MKRRIVFALISVLICVGAVVWLVPYTPMSDTAEIVDVLVLHVHAGDTAEDITGQVDTNAVCELLPQIRARRLPSYHRGISEDCYQIQVVYGGKTVCFSLGEPSYAYGSQKVCHRGYISCPAARNSSRCLMNNKREGSA